MQAVKWSSILEVHGAGNIHLSPGSSSLDFSLTNREGDETLDVNDTAEPFEICLATSPHSEENSENLQYVIPDFKGKDDFLIYHQVVFEKEGAAVKVDFLPDADAEDYVLLYGIGYKPSLSAYEGREFLKYFNSSEGCICSNEILHI